MGGCCRNDNDGGECPTATAPCPVDQWGEGASEGNIVTAVHPGEIFASLTLGAL